MEKGRAKWRERADELERLSEGTPADDAEREPADRSTEDTESDRGETRDEAGEASEAGRRDGFAALAAAHREMARLRFEERAVSRRDELRREGIFHEHQQSQDEDSEMSLKIAKTDSRAGRRLVDELLRRGETILDPKIIDRAGRLVGAVRGGGDRALLKAVRRYDGVRRARRVADLHYDPRNEPASTTAELPAGFEEALEQAIGAVERYHAGQAHDGFTLEQEGVTLEELRRPLSRVGIYVPGGRAAYPSTVLMTVIPARAAGVRDIAVVTPPGMLESSAALRYTLKRLKVEEVWGMGGAHAIAALAYGTETIRRVDKIVGPGNAWVTAAKHLVSAEVAIDGLAGPSEVVVVAIGEGLNAAQVASDLLAQAEHDPQALAVLVTDDNRFAKQVGKAVRHQLPRLETSKVAREALSRQGGALVVEDLDEALKIVDRLAPEHLQLVGSAAESLAERVRHAGAIFVGASTPEVFGDYVAGPSHVLPTAGTARFTSALGVEDFVRRSHIVRVEPAAAPRLAKAAAILADVEGLPAHAASARQRLGEDEA